MNYLDIALIVILVMGFVQGLYIGFVQIFFNLVGWAIALIVAIKYYDDVAPLMAWASESIWQQNVLAFIIIILSIMMVIWGITLLLDQTFKKLKLTPVNRILGAVFGISKSTVVILVLLNIFTPIFGKMPMWQQSQIIQFLYPYAPMATKWSKHMTMQMKQRVGDYLNSDDVLPKMRQTSPSSTPPSSSEKSSNREVKNPFSP